MTTEKILKKLDMLSFYHTGDDEEYISFQHAESLVKYALGLRDGKLLESLEEIKDDFRTPVAIKRKIEEAIEDYKALNYDNQTSNKSPEKG